VRLSWSDVAEPDEYLRTALTAAAAIIESDPRPLAEIREEDLRALIYSALAAKLGAHVRNEQVLELPAFRGVGGFDILIDRAPGGPVAWLGDVKCSYTSRPKIFEVWDAVKLCMAAERHAASRCWLITVAPHAHSATAETRQRFADGTASIEALWTEPLRPAESQR
jgi:hypothetical protein